MLGKVAICILFCLIVLILSIYTIAKDKKLGKLKDSVLFVVFLLSLIYFRYLVELVL